jgi:carotenoid cleavage dioxygenase-like enzyme
VTSAAHRSTQCPGGRVGSQGGSAKADRRTGELHAITYSFRRENVQHVVIDSTGKVSRVTEIVVPDKPMMHDFALTQKYVVLYDLPVTFSMDAVSAGSELPYVWNPKHEARVGLLRLDASSVDVRWFAVDPCFIIRWTTEAMVS